MFTGLSGISPGAVPPEAPFGLNIVSSIHFLTSRFSSRIRARTICSFSSLLVPLKGWIGLNRLTSRLSADGLSRSGSTGTGASRTGRSGLNGLRRSPSSRPGRSGLRSRPRAASRTGRSGTAGTGRRLFGLLVLVLVLVLAGHVLLVVFVLRLPGLPGLLAFIPGEPFLDGGLLDAIVRFTAGNNTRPCVVAVDTGPEVADTLDGEAVALLRTRDVNLPGLDLLDGEPVGVKEWLPAEFGCLDEREIEPDRKIVVLVLRLLVLSRYPENLEHWVVTDDVPIAVLFLGRTSPPHLLEVPA